MVYIHVPFCRSFCTYCDFYSEILCKASSGGQLEAWVEGICREAGARSQEIAESSFINTLYFGGGTPSVLPLSAFSRIISCLGNDDYTELTVEVNPDDIVSKGVDYIRGLRDLGVNRISMGVQSLDDSILKWMNRRHDAAAAERAFGIIREGGIENISADIIFGAGGMSDDSVETSLDTILSWGPEHISAYQLSIGEGSALADQLRRGEYTEADEQDCSRQYGMISGKLAGAGFHHYEISNWSRPGYEAVHNSAYWSRMPYVGLGPGAHSFRIMPQGTQVRSWNSSTLSGWIADSEVLSEEDIRTETLMLGLRTDRGVPAGDMDAEKAEMLLKAGRLEKNGENMRISESCLFVSDSIITDIL